MPYLKLDWHALITDDLPALHSCDEAARAAFVSATRTKGLPNAAFEPEDIETLLRAGLVEKLATKDKIVQTQKGRRLSGLMRHAYIPPSRSHPASVDPRQGLIGLLGADAAFALVGQKAPRYNHQADGGAWPQLAQPTWPETLLKLKSAKAAAAFEAKHHRKPVSGSGGDHGPYFGDTKVRKAAQAMLRHFFDQTDKIAPEDLLGAFADLDAAVFSRAFEALVRYGMVFLWTDGPYAHHTQLRLGLWPRITQRLQRTALPAPIAVPAADVGPPTRPGWVRDDLNALLIAAAEAPLRLKANSNHFYAADLKRIETAFTPADDPLRQRFEQQLGGLTEAFSRYDHPADPDTRIQRALLLANQMDLLQHHAKHGKAGHLMVNNDGRGWLGQTPGQQTEQILGVIVPHALQLCPLELDAPVPYWSLTPDAGGIGSATLIFHEDPAALLQQAAALLGAPLKARQTKKARSAFRPAAPAVAHAARHANPLADELAAIRQDRKRSRGRDWVRKRAWEALNTTDELAHEALWHGLLENLCVELLLPLGGLDLTEGPVNDDGTPGPVLARLTPVGRVLLRVAGFEDLADDPAPSADGAVIIQPNFDVVFMGSAPQAQATIAGFAERTGPPGSLGTLFKITKKAVTRAAAHGRSAAQIAADLQAVTDKPVPDNVLREVAHWAGQVRRVTTRLATLIEAPDADTARRVKGALSKKAELVGETTLVLNTKTLSSAMRERLKKDGLFVD